ncbi:crossover junction endodeoxyribonuclease RuvC [Murdochiella massiliensis]|uniref:crossover junction endodeoxyribonuclease RuvC n=1 Tax=Murdochiella massiliensis TaxID=1673723 RepID=UPI00082F0D4D|nr:crossover junction endodeoxyribonuclease RuvC [Murdochiella massiliensis]
MRIVGIDPGLARMGYGIIDFDGNFLRPVTYGCIETPAHMPLPARLRQLDEQLDQLLKDAAPDEAAFEELFFYQNKTTGITVAQARGVEVNAVERLHIPLYEYTPGQIKQAMTGYGRANKTQIQNAVKMLLRLDRIPKPDDAADGLAVAITHAFGQRFKEQQRMR